MLHFSLLAACCLLHAALLAACRNFAACCKIPLSMLHFSLLAACCLLHAECCTFRCLLQNPTTLLHACCMLRACFTAHRLPHDACCAHTCSMMYAACCMLHTACCRLLPHTTCSRLLFPIPHAAAACRVPPAACLLLPHWGEIAPSRLRGDPVVNPPLQTPGPGANYALACSSW